MICCGKEMHKFRGAVRECVICGMLKFDNDLDKENRKKEAEEAKRLKAELRQQAKENRND